ncbi:ferritin family protein [Defluviitalea phaphyphila]|uniref:hypothetical protein n=1 Tax=Defluviitalea phaphyphila TaxID=1473580 RepID=UPI00072FA697|nr:hypothetical protein [Defluviitalea phaphyphila]
MPYTPIDVIEQLISIEKNAVKMYDNIIKITDDKKIKVVLQVLKKEEIRHVNWYIDLKEKIEKEEQENIDFYFYDKIFKLIMEFKQKMYIPSVSSPKELINEAIYFEKSQEALLIDIQGRILTSNNDISTKFYQLLNKLIKEERKHSENLSRFL